MTLSLVLAALLCPSAGAAGLEAPRAAAIKAFEAIKPPAVRPAAAPPPPSSPLFESFDTLVFRLDADFTELFKRRWPEPGQPPLPSVAGRLAYESSPGKVTALDVTVAIRGNSTRDCAFPKLKIKFADSPEFRASIFRGARGVKLGTHCADGREGDPFGGVLNQKLAHREAFAYKLLEIMEIMSYRTRPARATYMDPAWKRPITRNAFFLEDEDDAGPRHGGTEVEAVPGRPPPLIDRLDPAQVAGVFLAEAAANNGDWVIEPEPGGGRLRPGSELWNVRAYRRPDGSHFLMPHDFNLSFFVIGWKEDWWLPVNPAYFAEGEFSPIRASILYQLQLLRLFFERPIIEAALARFRRHETHARAALESMTFVYPDIESGELAADPEPKPNMKRHLDDFFGLLEPAEVIVPAMLRKDMKGYEDPERTKPLCEEPVPIGMPLRVIEERAGSRLAAGLLKLCRSHQRFWIEAADGSIGLDVPLGSRASLKRWGPALKRP